MRRTVYRNGKSTKTLYQRVTDRERISRMEYESENWLRCEGRDYVIRIQRDVSNHWTERYKIKKSDSLFSLLTAGYSNEDWLYYERSNGTR